MPRPPKSKAERRIGLAVYVAPAVLRALRLAADEERRSTSAQASLYIERALGVRPRGRPSRRPGADG